MEFEDGTQKKVFARDLILDSLLAILGHHVSFLHIDGPAGAGSTDIRVIS